MAMTGETLIEAPPTMGRKKGELKTVMVRTYEDFAEKVKRGAGERGVTIAEFCSRFLTPCAERAHRDYIKAESRKLGGKVLKRREAGGGRHDADDDERDEVTGPARSEPPAPPRRGPGRPKGGKGGPK